MQDRHAGSRENEKETNHKICNDTNHFVDDKMNVERNKFDEEYRKYRLDNEGDIIKENMDADKGKGKDKVKDKDTDKEKEKHGHKTVHWIDDEDEKSLMDLGVSEVERTKRLENLMERRRTRKMSNFQIIRNAMGIGVGNQISSLNIPKKNPFLSRGDPHSGIPGSAPTYMAKNNPFDLPYDPHEEKPILTGDNFDEEPTVCRRERKIVNCENERLFDSDFAMKELRRLGTSKVANKKDDNKSNEQNISIPNDVIDDNHAIEEKGESSKKAVDTVEKAVDAVTNAVDAVEKAVNTVDQVDHEISSNQSTSSSSSSEDEPPILRPNKEAILHCLSMSRMRVISQGSNIRRNAESFDCGPSALFDKSKTDSFFFGSNKRVHYGSTNSVASDMQVEVSEVGSPPSTTNMSFIDEDGKGSLVSSTNPSELDLNEVRLRDIEEVSERDSDESDDDRDGFYFTKEDRRSRQDYKDDCGKPESSTNQCSPNILHKDINDVRGSNDRIFVVEPLDQLVPDSLPLVIKDSTTKNNDSTSRNR